MGCCCGKKKKGEQDADSSNIDLTEDELNALRELFDKACSKEGKMSEADLEALWGNLCDKKLLDKLMVYLYGDEGKQYINFQEFSNLYKLMVKGNGPLLAQLVVDLSSGRRKAKTIPSEDIAQLMRAVLSTCFIAEKNSHEYKSWKKVVSPLTGVPGEMLEEYENGQLASHMINDLGRTPNKERFTTKNDIEPWLVGRGGDLISITGNQLFNQGGKKPQMVPRCVASSKHGPPSILDHNSIWMINSELPKFYRSKWTALFSSRVDGLDFETMINCILQQGPTIIIVADTKGGIFGGFAPISWRIEAVFYGNEETFVFKLMPKMATYKSSGNNKNYMYLNNDQQVLPNGFGMGGQIGCFGFFLDENLEKGHSAKFCKTFNNESLSSDPEFTVNHVEVWGLAK